MREEEYSEWLQSYVTNAAIMNYIKRCQRVEANLNITLDDEFKKDKGESLCEKLIYTTDDQRHNRHLKCDIYFKVGSDLRKGMASLRTAVMKYFEFCDMNIVPANTSVYKKEYKRIQNSKNEYIDSYQEFLNHFEINRNAFFEWGISSTIFPPVSKVKSEWDSLKTRIFNNKKVYIRGYGRDAQGTQLFKDLYKKLFNHSCVEKDPTNNAEPRKLIQKLTGRKLNSDIYHYQVSHIWGRTKNLFMFEAPWNICYTPKIVDPFTGHETRGSWSDEYQKLFIARASELYKPFVDEYNQLLIKFDIKKRISEYICSQRGEISEEQLKQFAKDAVSTWDPIL